MTEPIPIPRSLAWYQWVVINAAHRVAECALQRDTAGLSVCATCMGYLRGAIGEMARAHEAAVAEAAE